jgi:hypothetical protein
VAHRDDVEAICGDPDAARRAQRATVLMGELSDDIVKLSRLRTDAVRELLASNWIKADVARLLGLGKARITQMTKP